MEIYKLKEKISISKELISNLEAKSWQDIEYLQNQLANLADTEENASLLQLLNNLLTSYYVFIGGLENLSETNPWSKITNIKNINGNSTNLSSINELNIDEESVKGSILSDPKDEKLKNISTSNFEPFEYFVDFDEPSGLPISDRDLYGN